MPQNLKNVQKLKNHTVVLLTVTGSQFKSRTAPNRESRSRRPTWKLQRRRAVAGESERHARPPFPAAGPVRSGRARVGSACNRPPDQISSSLPLSLSLGRSNRSDFLLLSQWFFPRSAALPVSAASFACGSPSTSHADRRPLFAHSDE